MSLPLTRKSTDRSSEEEFAFSFFCDRCGKEWQSEAMPFVKGHFSSIEHEEAHRLLWAHERKVAFEQANLDARMFFNLCPKCGRRVCEDCFCPGDKRHQDSCKDCF